MEPVATMEYFAMEMIDVMGMDNAFIKEILAPLVLYARINVMKLVIIVSIQME